MRGAETQTWTSSIPGFLEFRWRVLFIKPAKLPEKDPEIGGSAATAALISWEMEAPERKLICAEVLGICVR